MISPMRRPKAAPGGEWERYSHFETNWTTAQQETLCWHYQILLPNMNTGIKAPEGMGIVVETADIQNCGTQTGWRWDWDTSEREILSAFIFVPRRRPPYCWHTGKGGGDGEGWGDTFMTKKRRRMTKTLTWGWSQADERPRPGGGGDPEILVQVKLSKREFMHSLGMSCTHTRVHNVTRKSQTGEKKQTFLEKIG